jgi:hypothetical protein
MIWKKMRRETSFDENPSCFDKFFEKYSNIPRFPDMFFDGLIPIAMSIRGYRRDSAPVYVEPVDMRWRRHRKNAAGRSDDAGRFR